MGEKDRINFYTYKINNYISDHHDDEDDRSFGLMLPVTEEYDSDVSDLFSYDIDRNASEYDTGDLFSYDIDRNASEYDTSDLFSFDLDRNVNDSVCVVAWKLGSAEMSLATMDALVWTLDNESTTVCLVHVFPRIRFIPTPMGRLPISQANPVQKEGYQIQERSKRREYLEKLVSVSSSSKVEVKIVLIESDKEAKAILDLIPILNIRKLVLGATKLTLSKLESNGKKGRSVGTLDQILHNAPEICEVKVICEGKEVLLQDQFITTPHSPSLRDINAKTIKVKPIKEQQERRNGFFICCCFMF